MIRARSSLRLAAMLLLLGTTGIASAADVAELMAPLMAARERQAFGSVDGRAYAEGQRGGAESTPYPSVSVLLLPRSAEFDSELEAIKAGLVDEYHLFITPVVVGGGTAALPSDAHIELELVDQRRFASGVIHLHYRARG